MNHDSLFYMKTLGLLPLVSQVFLDRKMLAFWPRPRTVAGIASFFLFQKTFFTNFFLQVPLVRGL